MSSGLFQGGFPPGWDRGRGYGFWQAGPSGGGRPECRLPGRKGGRPAVLPAQAVEPKQPVEIHAALAAPLAVLAAPAETELPRLVAADVEKFAGKVRQ